MTTSALPRLVRAAVLLGLAGVCCAGCGPALDTTRGTLWTAPPGPALDEAAEAQDNWPGWRGVNAAGVSQTAGLPTTWSSAQHIAWRVEVPGSARSSPIVWEDSIVLTTAIGRDSAPMLAVVCLSRGDGTTRWTTEIGPALDPRHTISGLASATPVTDGEAIYAFFGSNGLVALDFDGKILWRAPLGEMQHDWGLASSPVLFGDLVIQLCDNKSQSSIAAFNKRSGEPVWRTPRDSYGCWSTPALAISGTDAGQRSELVVNGTGTDQAGGGWVIAYDPLSGSELWRVQGTTDSVWPSPIVGAGMIFSTSGRNGPVMAIRPGGSGDVTHSHVAWRKRHGAPYVPTGVVYRNRLYLLTDGGTLSCYNAADGNQVWRHHLDGIYTASLVAGDGKIYACSERGRVSVIEAADTFRLLAVNDLNERLLATPAIARDRLVIRTQSHVTCIEPGPQGTHPPEGDEAASADNNVAARPGVVHDPFDEENIVSPSDRAEPVPEEPAPTAASEKSPAPKSSPETKTPPEPATPQPDAES